MRKKKNKTSEVKKEDKISKFINRYDKIVLLSYSEHRDIYRNREELKIENDTIIIPKVKFIDNVTLDNKFSRKIGLILFLRCYYYLCNSKILKNGSKKISWARYF